MRCDLGLDHGPGVMDWIHPPVHRLLGWVSRPSALRMTREVWRLDQCCGLTDQQIYVRGEPAVTDPATLDRLPTLLESDLLARDGERLAAVVDLVFEPSTGAIAHYLVARSDPRLPGSSRWNSSNFCPNFFQFFFNIFITSIKMINSINNRFSFCC